MKVNPNFIFPRDIMVERGVIQMPRKPVRDWLTTKEAAAYMGFSVAYLTYMARNGILPNSDLTDLGWLHLMSDLEKLAAERKANPPKRGRVKGKNRKSKLPPRVTEALAKRDKH